MIENLNSLAEAAEREGNYELANSYVKTANFIDRLNSYLPELYTIERELRTKDKALSKQLRYVINEIAEDLKEE